MSKKSLEVVVVGGGISGLTAAYALMEESKNYPVKVHCTILERENRWGGKILTTRTGGYLIEKGPDSFLTSKPWGIELCRALGLDSQIIPTNAENNRTFSYSQGALRELPQGLLSFRPERVSSLVTGGLLSLPGLLRMGAERFWPKLQPLPSDETLGAFFRRRFGREAFDRLIEPLVAGIYAGDADELSIEATFPRFRQIEREHGSVIKGMRGAVGKPQSPSSSGKKMASLFVTLRDGLGTLIDTLTQHLSKQGVSLFHGRECEEVRLGTQSSPRFLVTLKDSESLPADAVVLATPSFQAGHILRNFLPEGTAAFQNIPYTSTATISLAYPTPKVASLIEGFGFVVPRKEQRRLMAATWTSLKWPQRCPSGDTLIRCYVGGRGREELLELDDVGLVEAVRQELQTIVGLTEVPTFSVVHRWIQGMPQYLLGHQDGLATITELLRPWPHLQVTGAGYRGIGIPDCIREATQVGKSLLQTLAEHEGDQS